MSCITAFIAAVPTANRDVFITHVHDAADVFQEYGLSSAAECWGDDVPEGKLTDFRRAVLAEPDETVIFSWYGWPSKAAQEEVMEKVMSDPRAGPEQNPMPFDGKRVVYGHFEPVLEFGAAQPGGYVDGYVVAVPKDARADYEAFAKVCDPVFMEHGAVWIMEAWELEVPDGKLTDFRRAVAAKPDEAIVVSWVQWPNRAARDAGNAAIMADERLAAHDCPFDMTRLIHGGFEPVLMR
ncbi:DUF1428 domain-containing protein [Alkalicaulis satelles]|uniref:DUF1428 domain-containing protein n=1 Tax=Alkalicaulis satelles TaxID=2609175 RepID=A0A5M6ZKA6_9PROT|nr:DUF1428 domain-containing protein [Alkalicaulis satelles]KAA5804770.1 DUF1428 domain-containing protein [Alkalicaulis satelles]